MQPLYPTALVPAHDVRKFEADYSIGTKVSLKYVSMLVPKIIFFPLR
jgi:hypothetical protein